MVSECPHCLRDHDTLPAARVGPVTAGEDLDGGLPPVRLREAWFRGHEQTCLERDLAGLRAFLAHTPHCRLGVLACGGRSVLRLGDRLAVVPLSLLLE
jgi:hypothetical protein